MKNRKSYRRGLLHSVYMLLHPVTNQVFYVGRTRFNLDFRLKLHMWECKRRTTKIASYLQQLIKEELRPKIELIEVTDNMDREAFWIERYMINGELKNTWHPKWELKGKKAS